LKNKYNVKVVWQAPNSPETNLLDLGYHWRSMQARVEIAHRTKRMNETSLVETVMHVWQASGQDVRMALKKIAARWSMVLDLILEDNGGNDKVEANRGRLFQSVDLS
jgi:hypothetical protein